jgi:hypothetical protein
MICAKVRLCHSRPSRADSKPSHFRYAPIANKFRSPAKWRDVPQPELVVPIHWRRPASLEWLVRQARLSKSRSYSVLCFL